VTVLAAVATASTAFQASPSGPSVRPGTFGRRTNAPATVSKLLPESRAGADSEELLTRRKSEISALKQSVDQLELNIGTLERDLEQDLAKVLQPAIDVGVFAMRVGTCALMVHHGLDKIQNVDGFSANVVQKFFGFLPGAPSFWTYSAAATQVVGAGLLGIGLFSRPVALSMLGTMLAAVIFHLENTGVEGFPLAVVKQHSYNYELAAMYVIVLGYFTAAGGGSISVDEQVLGGELEFYYQLTMGRDKDKEER